MSALSITVCVACEHGEHGAVAVWNTQFSDPVAAAVGTRFCGCPCHGATVSAFVTGRESGLSSTDAERVTDRREDVTDWLSNAVVDVEWLIRQLGRAHADACEFEPVTALVILPLIEAARAIEAKLAELTSVRGTKC